MAETLRWELVIDDKGAPKIVAAGNNFENLGKKSETAGRRMRKMGDDAEKSSDSVKGLSGAAAATAVAVGSLAADGIQNLAGAMVNQIAIAWDYTASLKDMSDRLGISTDDLQLMSEWTEQSGTDLETAAKAMGKLTVKIADGDATLKRYGITNGNVNEAFLQVADAVEKAATQQEKAKIANAAFGKSWQELMPILKLGREGLAELSGNLDLISEADIQAVADLDDALAHMKGAARGLAAELLGAFGPTLQRQLEETAATIKIIRDYMDKESEGDFLDRIGAKKGAIPFTRTLPQSSVGQMSSADLQRIMDYGGGANGFSGSMGLVQYEKPGMQRDILAAFPKAKAREKAAAEKAAAEEAKRREEDARAQAALEAAGLAAEDAAKRADADRKAQAEADAYRRNIANVDLSPETGGYSFLDQQVYNRNREEAFQKVKDSEYTQKPKERFGPSLAGQMDQYGWTSGNTYSYATSGGMNQLDLGTATPDQIRAATEEAKAFHVELAAIADAQDLANQKTAEYAAAWERVSGSIADTASGELAPALWDVFGRGHDAMEEFGDAAGNILRNLTMEFAQLAIKWAILQGLSAGMGGAGPGSFLSFLGGGGHATGTVSSPGGILALGERGPEPFRTPSGQMGIATGGLYSVPRGTQVWKNQGNMGPITIAPVFHANGANANDLAKAMIPKLRSLVLDTIDSRGRTRDS